VTLRIKQVANKLAGIRTAFNQAASCQRQNPRTSRGIVSSVRFAGIARRLSRFRQRYGAELRSGFSLFIVYSLRGKGSENRLKVVPDD